MICVGVTPEQTFERLLGSGESSRVAGTDYETGRNTYGICIQGTVALWPEEGAELSQTVSFRDHVKPMQRRPGIL
jgi:hypothetical protein